MAIEPQILSGQVMHKRLAPKVNAFTYGIYYVALPLSRLKECHVKGWFGINRFGLMAFYNKDHGHRTSESLLPWIKDILHKQRADDVDGEVILVTMPRTIGYVFNPVSFWLCYDSSETLRAVLCEVNNTFGETHSYLCIHDDHRAISSEDIFESEKLFHVSPFLKRDGKYKFRFAKTDKGFGAWIDYEEDSAQKVLLTSLTGQFIQWTSGELSHVFWRYPLVSLRALGLIHWQALKLIAKGIRYIAKPAQLKIRLTRGSGITNN